MMTQSEELGIQCFYFTAEAVKLKEGFPPWALINWETDRKCITYHCFPPSVNRNIELETAV